MYGIGGIGSVIVHQCSLKFKAVISGSLEGHIAGQAGNQVTALGEE